MTSGTSNTFAGSLTGSNTTTGNGNTFLGASSGVQNVEGSSNVFIGYFAGLNNSMGSDNVCIGTLANRYSQTGSRNTVVGKKAGHGNAEHSKSGNVLIGYQAGYYETGDDKLYINNDSSDMPLIYGDFDIDELTINGSLVVRDTTGFSSNNVAYFENQSPFVSDIRGIKSTSDQYDFFGIGAELVGGYIGSISSVTPTGSNTYYGARALCNGGSGTNYGLYAYASGSGTNYAVYADGDIAYTGSLMNVSDARVKKDITPLTGSLAMVMALNAKSYRYDLNAYPEVSLSAGTHYGFIAQELEAVLPELVNDGVFATTPSEAKSAGDGIKLKGVEYQELIPILTQAIQEQQAIIQQLEERIAILEQD